MSLKATLLHEEIRSAMIDHNVDPFERSYRCPGEDFMVFEATQNAPHLEKGTKGNVSFDYWRKFSTNRKFLEAKSANYSIHEEKKEFARTQSRKARFKLMKQRNQDVRQASSRKSYSFAPPPRACAKFDDHMIGPINPVTNIAKDLKDGSPNKDSEEVSSTNKRSKNFKASVILCHGDIGSGTRGGKMGQAPARPAPSLSATQTANVPSSRELDGGDRVLPGGAFAIAARFPPPPEAQSNATAVPLPPEVDPTAYFKGKFRDSDRFRPGDPLDGAQPAPGSYDVPRLFDSLDNRRTSERALQLLENIRNETGIKKDNCPDISRKAVFAYGCSFDEHVKYGLCLDGLCGRRASWEDVMLLKNDSERLGGKVMKDGRKYSQSFIGLCSDTSPVVRTKGHTLDYTPLKSAALCGDLDTVVRLCELGSNINEVDNELGQTALHHCVIRGHMHMVNFLTGGCEGWDDRDPIGARCRRLFENVIDLNVQDRRGDTPLHIACRDGRKAIVEALCDAGAVPDSIHNSENNTPSDIARTQEVYQVIKMCETLWETERELSSLQFARKQAESKVRRRLKTMVNTAQTGAYMRTSGNTKVNSYRSGARLRKNGSTHHDLPFSSATEPTENPEIVPEKDRSEWGSGGEDASDNEYDEEEEEDIVTSDETEKQNASIRGRHSFAIGFLLPEKRSEPFVGGRKKTLKMILGGGRK